MSEEEAELALALEKASARAESLGTNHFAAAAMAAGLARRLAADAKKRDAAKQRRLNKTTTAAAASKGSRSALLEALAGGSKRRASIGRRPPLDASAAVAVDAFAAWLIDHLLPELAHAGHSAVLNA